MNKNYRIICITDAHTASNTHRYAGKTVLQYDGKTPVRWVHDDNCGQGFTLEEARAKLMSYAREDAEKSGEKVHHRLFENTYEHDVWTYAIDGSAIKEQTGKKFHYEWAAFTDNLNWGRMKIIQDKDKGYVEHVAANAGKGCYVIEKVRVYND